MPGDSGGPLFFGSGEDPVVVGICSSGYIDPIPGQGAGYGYFRIAHFEAVDRHLDWIRGVMAGTSGGGLELPAGAKPSPAAGGLGPPPAPEAKEIGSADREAKEPRPIPAPPPAAPGQVSAPDPGSPSASPGPAINPDRR